MEKNEDQQLWKSYKHMEIKQSPEWLKDHKEITEKDWKYQDKWKERNNTSKYTGYRRVVLGVG